MKLGKMSPLGLLAALLGATASSAHASVAVQEDGGFIEFCVPLKDMTNAQLKEVINGVAGTVEDQMNAYLTGEIGPTTLDKEYIPDAYLNPLIQSSQDLINQNVIKHSGWPTGILVFGGGTASAALMVKFGLSGDIGVVFVPQMCTRARVPNKFVQEDAHVSHYYTVSMSPVIIPHLHAGLGIGGGASTTWGAGLIWGDLAQASDFQGVIGTVSAGAKFWAGANVGLSYIYDGPGKSFTLLTGSVDAGVEAEAAVDVEGGGIIQIPQLFSIISARSSTIIPGSPIVPVSPTPPGTTPPVGTGVGGGPAPGGITTLPPLPGVGGTGGGVKPLAESKSKAG